MYSGKDPITVLIVSSSIKGVEMIKNLLDDKKCDSIRIAKTGSEARMLLISYRYDIMIINAPLSDEFGDELAIHAASDDTAGVMLLAKHDIFNEVRSKVESYGIISINKPVYRQIFEQSFIMLKIISIKWEKLINENKKTQKKLEELRVVSRAKCILIEHKKITEADAHRYIEKQAMNERKTKKSVAEGIIRFYNT